MFLTKTQFLSGEEFDVLLLKAAESQDEQACEGAAAPDPQHPDWQHPAPELHLYVFSPCAPPSLRCSLIFVCETDYILSNNHVNDLIVHKFDFSDDEILEYYISLLKTLSLKLNPSTVQFFFREVPFLSPLS